MIGQTHRASAGSCQPHALADAGRFLSGRARAASTCKARASHRLRGRRRHQARSHPLSQYRPGVCEPPLSASPTRQPLGGLPRSTSNCSRPRSPVRALAPTRARANERSASASGNSLCLRLLFFLSDAALVATAAAPCSSRGARGMSDYGQGAGSATAPRTATRLSSPRGPSQRWRRR